MHRYWLVFAALSSVLAGPAAAQSIMNNPSMWYVNNQIYSMRVFHSAIANSTLGRRTGAGARSRTPRAATDEPNPPTFYRESSTSMIPALLAGTGAGGSRNADDARQLFTSYMDQYKQVARRLGYEHTDLAFAYTYFAVNNYSIYNDLMQVPYEKDPRALRASDAFDRISAMALKRTLMVTPERSRRVYEQFLAQLTASTEIRRMTNVQKQESAELLVTMYGVNSTTYMAGVDAMNDRQAQTGRDLARAGLEKLLGVPITHIGITHVGLDLTPP
jgi:hypothetical protein